MSWQGLRIVESCCMAASLTCNDDTGEKVQAQECSVTCTVQSIDVLFIGGSKYYLQMEKNC